MVSHAPTSGSLDIVVHWRPRRNWRARGLLQRVAAHVATAEGFTTGTLSIVVVGTRAMTTLHRTYTDQDGPTDVLTFDLDSDPIAGILEAEIVVCADVALRRARPRAQLRAARAELALYVTHGILHLASYDDHEADDYRRMHAREDELLAELGLGNVFARGDE